MSPASPPLSSRGLGRRPLTAETRVRIPVAVLLKALLSGAFALRVRTKVRTYDASVLLKVSRLAVDRRDMRCFGRRPGSQNLREGKTKGMKTQEQELRDADELSPEQIQEVFAALRLGAGSTVNGWNQQAVPAHQLVYFPVSGSTSQLRA